MAKYNSRGYRKHGFFSDVVHFFQGVFRFIGNIGKKKKYD